MAVSRAWADYSPTYRAKEMDILANWIEAGQSGAVVGLAGAGKSNLLGFFGYRPEVLQARLQSKPVIVIPVDLNNLPAHNLATFYRVILRSFYEVRDRFDLMLQETITTLYRDNRAERDPFLPQSALRELLMLCQAQNRRVVLVLDRFDHFCQAATPAMLNTLRGLRDSFKNTLCYIVGLRYEMAYLADQASLGELYEILDTHLCWVGAMAEADARRLIVEETDSASICPTEEEMAHLLTLTGGYPSLLKAACHWWLAISDKPTLAEEWADLLLAERSIQYRLEEIWQGLTQEEQLLLSEMQNLSRQTGDGEKMKGRRKTVAPAFDKLEPRHRHTLTRLAAKGLCRPAELGWNIVGDLLAIYTSNVSGRSRGQIWLDQQTGELYQGQTRLADLEPLERALLHFLIKQPRLRHTQTTLIEHTWSEDDIYKKGISPESLYQLVSKLRKKIEPDPTKPYYLVVWRGKPEGGYQFFPEGRPG
jgi:hypothetical protein